MEKGLKVVDTFSKYCKITHIKTTNGIKNMQAITTKFLGPTNTKGSRIKASCWLKTVIVSWNYALNLEDNHKAAVQHLIGSLNLDRANKDNSGSWEMVAIGSLADSGYAAIIDLNF